MSFDYIDALYRSRLTLMKILDSRGYETEAYSRFSPKEIQAMAVNIATAGFTVPHKTDKARKCVVMYTSTPRLNKRAFNLEQLEIDEESAPNIEVIVMTIEPVKEAHDALALNFWTADKLRVAFFCIYSIINNPMDHILVPPHERITAEEQAALMEKVTSKSQLPMIRFHADPIARILGLVPGEIIKITRPSPSAGVYTVYRVCAP